MTAMYRNKTIDIIAFGLMTLATLTMLTACPDDKSSEETGPASRGETSTGEQPKPATAN